MKLFTGWVVSAGLAVMAAAANAQTLAPQGLAAQGLASQVLPSQVLAPSETGRSPYRAVSDIEGPYAAMRPEIPAPRYRALLPPMEVYAILRESGFLPLGIPQQHGLVYTISVIDRGGDDGRLVIDARSGRILRFMPAYRMGDNFNENLTATYGAVGPGPLPPVSAVRGPPRPPAFVPHVVSRTPPSVPMPRAAPPRAGEAKALAAKPDAEPAAQSAAVQAKHPDAPPVPQAAAPAVEAKPAAPQIRPTQDMPKVQGLE
jgi:hypothetical protein